MSIFGITGDYSSKSITMNGVFGKIYSINATVSNIVISVSLYQSEQNYLDDPTSFFESGLTYTCLKSTKETEYNNILSGYIFDGCYNYLKTYEVFSGWQNVLETQ